LSTESTRALPTTDVRPPRDDRESGKRKKGIADDIRSEHERDVDRIMYSYYFRRLAEITQVSSDDENGLRHNRMTHSLKVAQVGRRLVQYLENPLDEKYESNRLGIDAVGGIDRNVVTAAGLLHDFGHPPFGHIGELQLNKWAEGHKLEDGFEGNAQTLRVILSLTAHQRRDEHATRSQPGMDLTRAVVAACVKYPWSRQEAGMRKPGKWGYYAPDAERFHRFVAPSLSSLSDDSEAKAPSLEAEIMDWADDITYAVHDLQDFYADGIIPLHHLRHNQRGNNYEPVNPREFNDFWQYVTEKLHDDSGPPSHEARHIFEEYASRFPDSSYNGTREEAARIGSLASEIITDASKATNVMKNGRLHVAPNMKSVIGALKEITWYYVIDHPDLVSVQIGQRARVDEMCARLYKRVHWCFRKADSDGTPFNKDKQWALRRRLPTSLREFTEELLGSGAYDGNKEKTFARAVIDYVASMTEPEFDRLWQRMCPGEIYSKREVKFDNYGRYLGDEGV